MKILNHEKKMSNANRMELVVCTSAQYTKIMFNKVDLWRTSHKFLASVYYTQHTAHGTHNNCFPICWKQFTSDTFFFGFFICKSERPNQLTCALHWLLEQSQTDFFFIYFFSIQRRSNHFQLLSLCVVTVINDREQKKEQIRHIKY